MSQLSIHQEEFSKQNLLLYIKRATCIPPLFYYTPVLELTTNTESVSGVQYSCESRPCLTLSGALSCAGGSIGITTDRKSAERTVLIANFRLFSPYFRVNSVDKSYRKAVINYLHESNNKIGENRRWSSTSGNNNMLSSRRAG